ncbi:hypothetical protein C0J52_26275 [Blattella germanica]|nr:hypothetical protein C0J52_26275 [Blattella germanica]
MEKSVTKHGAKMEPGLPHTDELIAMEKKVIEEAEEKILKETTEIEKVAADKQKKIVVEPEEITKIIDIAADVEPKQFVVQPTEIEKIIDKTASSEPKKFVIEPVIEIEEAVGKTRDVETGRFVVEPVLSDIKTDDAKHIFNVQVVQEQREGTELDIKKLDDLVEGGTTIISKTIRDATKGAQGLLDEVHDRAQKVSEQLDIETKETVNEDKIIEDAQEITKEKIKDASKQVFMPASDLFMSENKPAEISVKSTSDISETEEPSVQEKKQSLENIKILETAEMKSDTSPKVKDIQSDSKPIVTTPTLSRRGLGLGGSQRLTRDQRPPPLDVSHLIMCSDEGTDEDFDAQGYIVTEPREDAAPSQQPLDESIYRINSSPDILSESPLKKTVAMSKPSGDFKEKIIPKIVTEVVTTPDLNQENLISESDIFKNEKTVTHEQEALPTKKTPEPSMPIEEIIEQPLIAFDTLAEFQIPPLIPVMEEGEEEIHSLRRPMFRIESDDSTEQGMVEDIEALIEKANRELALELEKAGVKVTDMDDETPEDEEGEPEFFKSKILHEDPESQEPEEEVQESEEGEDEAEAKEREAKREKKLHRVERRFERMASETLEKEAAAEGSSGPEVELRREAEFERMVSQLSTEEVADCQREYSQLWDEGGLTPSEDWDSRDPDTPSGELEEDSTAASPPGTSV